MTLYNPINIGVIFPSRGLVFAETFKELLAELEPYRNKIYFSHGNSLPDCFNRPLVRALKGPHTHIWIVEDDMVLTPGILKELLEYNVPVVACDYPLTTTPSGTAVYDIDGEAIFTGTGCMLLKSEIFRGMSKPIFRSDISWGFTQSNGKVKFTAKSCDPDKVYGFHDVTFGLYQYLNKTPILVADTILSQRKLVSKGTPENNSGADKIVVLDKYKRIDYKLLDEDKIVLTDTEVVKINGKNVMVSNTKAKKLIEGGLIKLDTIGTYKNVMVDTNNIKKLIKYFKRA